MDDIDRCPACREQAEAPAPEVLLPELAPDLGELLLQQTAARALVGADELRQLGLRLGAEQHVRVIDVVVPRLQGDAVGRRDVLENLPGAVGYRVGDDPAAVLHHQHEMVVHEKHRMVIRLQLHR